MLPLAIQDTVQGLWRGLVPHRVKMLIWLSILGKINTKARLASIGIFPSSEEIYIFCSANMESHDHLFLSFPFSWQLWCWWPVFGIFNGFSHPHSMIHFIYGVLMEMVLFSRKSANVFVHHLSWTIWKERNAIIFGNSSSSLANLQELVLIRLSWWIHAWVE